MGPGVATTMATAGPAIGLIDTDILIDAERGRPDAASFLGSQFSANGPRISSVSVMELMVGCRNRAELRGVRRFVASVRVIPIDVSISRAAETLVETFSLGHGMEIPDALIAATALGHGLILYTKNVRHFRMIPRLAVLRPYP